MMINLKSANHNSADRSSDYSPPFLRWAGSKRRLLPTLKTFWTTSHKRYVEPFAGSACLFFALNPTKAILGDLNPELVSTYMELKYRLKAVLSELDSLPSWSKAEYMRLRSLDTSTLEPHVRAARFVYLNRFCFNGIYRTNLQGQFNVPYSGDGCGDMLVAASVAARKRITQETLIQVMPAHELNDSDNIFFASSEHFTDEDRAKLLHYGKIADKKHPKGFGVVVVFQHRSPNNTIPVLHANHVKWTGLFPRHD